MKAQRHQGESSGEALENSMPSCLHASMPRSLGATLLERGRCAFRVWAPRVKEVSLRLISTDGSERLLPMKGAERGYFEVTADDAFPADRYFYRLHDGDDYRDRPDPASRYQPEGVHGPSEIIGAAALRAARLGEPRYPWCGIDLGACIFYELHIGTFTEQGTFDAAIDHLDHLRDLGVTIIEIMPVAQFPGTRNWGYDGVLPFAVQNSYGGPDGLKRFVDACHERQLAVALDVVYNHFGPEGNYLAEFGDYFTDKYHTPWGDAVNFDEAGSDEVRRYFIENALMWVDDFHIDALRLDAVHAIYDQSANPFLHELANAVHELGARQGRKVHVIAESDLNDPRLIHSPARGGYGMDSQWSDDLHHALHALLTGEREGYYRDFGSLRDLGAALNDSYVYQGQYSPYRRRRHGSPPGDVPPSRFVVCAQNHDQVGNRAVGDRLRSLVSYEQYQLAAAVVLLSPFVPLLFMGEEHAETNPFLYFVSHTDADLVEAVRTGRKAEFAAFAWQGEVPDPQAEKTFLRSRVDHSQRASGEGAACVRWYKALIEARKAYAPLAKPDHRQQRIRGDESTRVMTIHRWHDAQHVLLAFNFSAMPAIVHVEAPAGDWRLVLHSRDPRYHDSPSRDARLEEPCYQNALQFELAPHTFALFLHEGEVT